MRQKILGADPDANTSVCCACGSEKYTEDISRFHAESRTLQVCEDCAEEFNREVANLGNSDELSAELFDRLAEWSKLQLILAFIPAIEQINSLPDVEEFFDALTAVIAWHPDDSFGGYEGADRKPTFEPNTATELDKCMDRCREICDRVTQQTADVYDLGMKSLEKAGKAPGWSKEEGAPAEQLVKGTSLDHPADFRSRHLGQLVGKTVSRVCILDCDGEFHIYGLGFTDGTLAWISRDPEMNGPGHLDIQPVTKGSK